MYFMRSNSYIWRRGNRLLSAQFVPAIDLTAPFCCSSSSSAQSEPLHSRIIQAGHPSTAIVPILDQWRQEGKAVNVPELQRLIRLLRNNKRPKHALQVAEWMISQKGYHLSETDIAVRLDLISKVHGLQKGEEYFNTISKSSKGYKVYGSLLNCYVRAKQLVKAEDLMAKIRNMGFLESAWPYETMLFLYSQTGKHKKLNALLQEMEEKGIIRSSKYAFSARLRAYVACSDIEGMEKFLIKMEADPILEIDFRSYIVAANGYLKVGREEKAVSMLKRAEAFISRTSKNLSYEILISLYASMGNRDEMFRVWNMYIKMKKVCNASYLCMINSLLKLNDMDGAERIWDEWYSIRVVFDIRIPNSMIIAYTRKGVIDKAEACLDKIVESGKKPDATSWDYMALGYQGNRQVAKAVESIKKAIAASKPRWNPTLRTVAACLKDLKGQGDIEGAGELLEIVNKYCHFSKGTTERLSRIIEDENGTESVPRGSIRVEEIGNE